MVDVVSDSEAVDARPRCGQAPAAEAGCIAALGQYGVVEREGHGGVQDVGALVQGVQGAVRVIEVDGLVRKVADVLREVRMTAVQQEVGAEAGRLLLGDPIAELDDWQLRLSLLDAVHQDELAHALLEDLHYTFPHAIGAGVLHGSAVVLDAVARQLLRELRHVLCAVVNGDLYWRPIAGQYSLCKCGCCGVTGTLLDRHHVDPL